MSDTTLVLSISGNTTLTGAQAANGGYEFSGTLTSSATVTWPSFAGFAAIKNGTVGGFSISCGVSGGTFATILNGETVPVWSDGTNFIRLTQVGGGVGATGQGQVVLASSPSVTSPTFINGTYNPNNTLRIGTGTAPHGAGVSMTLTFQNGTAASPSAVLEGNELGFVQVYGYDGTTFNQTIPNAWVFVATENWTTTAHGCVTNVQATPNGTTAGQNEISIGNGLTALNAAEALQGLGRGTINALSGVYDQGNRVYSPSNPIRIPMSYSGGTASQAAGTTAYYGSGCYTGGGAGSSIMIPINGTLGNLYIYFANGPGAGTYTATLLLNSASTGITFQVSGSTQSGSDTTHTASCGAGEAIFLQVAASANANTLQGLTWGFTISPS